MIPKKPLLLMSSSLAATYVISCFGLEKRNEFINVIAILALTIINGISALVFARDFLPNGFSGGDLEAEVTINPMALGG